jgi:long-chain acyl-CoA synthetase
VVGRKNAEDAKSEVAITAIIVPDFESPALAEKTPDEVYTIVRTAVMAINKKLPSFKHISDVEIRNEPFEKNSSRKIKRYKIK